MTVHGPDAAAAPTSPDTTPVVADLPPPSPDLPPSDPVQLTDPPSVRDLPSDPSLLRDLPKEPTYVAGETPAIDLFPPARDLPPIEVAPPDQRGVDLLVDLPPDVDVDLADRPRAEVRPVDLAADKPDSYVAVEEVGGAAYDCTSTGGTIDTQSCCNNTIDFRDTCTTAAGACGCSPSNSRTVRVCTCPRPSCFLPGYGCVSPGSTCTVGMDQTCNDNPVSSSTHGRCVADGRCICSEYAMAPSGKCL